jgi:phosphoribosylglycinamide formyltransferase-1
MASHGGSAARAVAEAIAAGRLDAEIRVVISNNSGSAALAWAAAAGIEGDHLSTATVRGRDGATDASEALDAAIRDRLRERGVGWVLLSGYLRPIGPLTLAAFRGRILNLHPALLPGFGGRGMYGDRVHAAVLAAGVAESGATVHVVDEVYDHGPVLGQRRVPVLAGDDVACLRERVMGAEAELVVETLSRLASGGR